MRLHNTSIRFPKAAVSPVLADGTAPNPFWNELQTMSIWAFRPIRRGEDVFYTGITDYEQLTIPKVLAIVEGVPQAFPGSTAEVINYPCWAKMAPAVGEQDMPAYLDVEPFVVQAATLDAQQNETPAVTRPRKWKEARIVREAEGSLYVVCSNGLEYWAGSKLLQLSQESGIELVARPPAVDAELPA